MKSNVSRTVYLNGEFIAEEDAKISVFDRGFLFADGVYEVTTVIQGKMIDFDSHLIRLRRSLNEIDMMPACSDQELLTIHRELIKLNSLKEGLIYMQVTRGVADRDFHFPDQDTKPSIVLFTQSRNIVDTHLARNGAKVITVDDLRWGRRDIKTVQLLYPSMAKMEAKNRGADDAWFVANGFVNEATASNTYIITDDNQIITRHLSNTILHGITRQAILKCAKRLNLTVEERPFSIEEALSAKEAFSTGSSSLVQPVIEIDGHKIGTGQPGEITKKIRETYLEISRSAAI